MPYLCDRSRLLRMTEEKSRNTWIDFVRGFLLPKVKFASTSSIATALDYGLYLILVYSGVPKVGSNLISASCGFLVNFMLQRRFIFELQRRVRTTFLLSMSFSIVGIGISTLFIYFLNTIPFFDQHQYITKLLVIGIMFFYNFYTKRFAFEKKVEW